MPDSAFDGFLPQALRYLAGELGPEAARAFEERLGCDPAAQDALCQAVRLTQEPTVAMPNPRYRRRVRRRLRRAVPRRARGRLFLVGAGLGLFCLLVLGAELGKPPAEAPDQKRLARIELPRSELAVALSWARFTEPREARLSRELRREAIRPPEVAPETGVGPEDLWAAGNTTAHLERAHEELRRQAARKRDLGSRGPAPADRKHL
jgi:hypothetical protein